MAERRSPRGRSGGPSLFAAAAPPQPLAARMRPRTLEEYVGQSHLLARGMPLPDDLVERPRTHARRERLRQRRLEQRARAA